MSSADENRDPADKVDPLEVTRVTADTADTESLVSGSSGSLIGTRLGDYQVMRKLGRGGMADVYAARHLSLGRDVALKVLRSDFARDKDYVQRFRREARAAAKLNHPNIVQVFDVGSVNSLHYITQELIDGENLRESLERRGVLNLSDAIEVLVGVASALEVASEAGITHRDIKPENIMRSARGIIKVADFGLARLGTDAGTSQAGLTQAGLTLGTPRYMSPEQVQGQAVDVRSDLYSLGVSMYHLLAGRPPFEADDPLALALMHLQETSAPLDRVRNQNDASGKPDLPEWLIAVVNRLMNKLPQDRFQSPTELLDAVRNEASTSNLGGFGVGTAAATIRLQRATDQARRERKRKQLRVTAAVLLPIACTAIAAIIAMRVERESVAEILSRDSVAIKDTVQEQYLIAIQRNDARGWKAVADYFPAADNATNADYNAKASLQLAAMLAEQGRLSEADQAFDSLLHDSSVDLIYQALALARRCLIAEQLGNTQLVADSKRQLKSLYAELQANNPGALRLLERTLSDEEQLQLGIGDP